jgi:glycosyltransferase involved in cell wall biosynthesis
MYKYFPRIVIIFPNKKEEDTIEHVIRTARKSHYNPEVIVVDAYSSDRIVTIANYN